MFYSDNLHQAPMICILLLGTLYQTMFVSLIVIAVFFIKTKTHYFKFYNHIIC